MNTPPTPLVTAAAGKTGRHSALGLLSRGLPVRAMVHREDARSAALRHRGAQIVVGNVNDVHDVRKALDSVAQFVMLTLPFGNGRIRHAQLPRIGVSSAVAR